MAEALQLSSPDQADGSNKPISSLKKSPSYREAQELLDLHIKRQRILKRYQHDQGGEKPISSPSDVRREAEKILNEILKKQLHHDLKNSPLLSHKYQRVVVEDEYSISQKFDDEYIMKGESFPGDEGCATYASVGAIDDIPYIDGVEEVTGNDGRSRSLPGSIQFSVKPQIGVSKTQSLSPQGLLNGHDASRSTSHPDKGSSSLSSHSVSPSPQYENRSIEEVQPTEPKVRRRFQSGSLSGTDTDSGSVVSPDRKKKSVFKRLQERIARAVSRDREKMELDGGPQSPDDAKKKKKKRKARSKNRKSKDSSSEILKERHTHKEGHIEQHHDKRNKDILLKSDELWESTDITDFEKSQNKHIEKHKKVKESTDLSGSSEKGFFGAIKRMTSRRQKTKSPRNSIKTSQSAYYQGPSKDGSSVSYDRVLSMPGGTGDINFHMSEETSRSNKGTHRHTTRTITSPRSTEGQGLSKIGPIHEKSISEPVQPSEPMVTNGHPEGGSTIPHGFRFQVSRDDGVKIPENKSFNINYCVDERERTVRKDDGKVVIETDIQRSQLAPPSDLEIDGAGASSLSGGRSPRRRQTQESDLDDDVDDLRIARVAQRIAEMGDTYMSGSSHVGSPVREQDEPDGEGLTELERKLRDSFREIGDAFSEKMTMSLEPKEAAIHIVKQVTYSKFKDTVKDIVGDNVGWQQLAMLFYVTKKATQLAGAGGAVAAQLKENCLQYVEDHFANWILNQGGWDSVLESDDTDFDIDL